MTVLVILLASAISFLLGFLRGALQKPHKKIIEKRETLDDELKRLREEYSNFLSYDGSEQ